MHWSPMTPDDMASVIRSKKKSTSHGMDGVTLTDLRCMPPAVLQAFCSMFAQSERTGEWPQQLVDGKVASLAKVQSPGSPADFRPVTVFSLLYHCLITICQALCMEAVLAGMLPRFGHDCCGLSKMPSSTLWICQGW